MNDAEILLESLKTTNQWCDYILERLSERGANPPANPQRSVFYYDIFFDLEKRASEEQRQFFWSGLEEVGKRIWLDDSSDLVSMSNLSKFLIRAHRAIKFREKALPHLKIWSSWLPKAPHELGMDNHPEKSEEMLSIMLNWPELMDVYFWEQMFNLLTEQNNSALVEHLKRTGSALCHFRDLTRVEWVLLLKTAFRLNEVTIIEACLNSLWSAYRNHRRETNNTGPMIKELVNGYRTFLTLVPEGKEAKLSEIQSALLLWMELPWKDFQLFMPRQSVRITKKTDQYPNFASAA